MDLSRFDNAWYDPGRGAVVRALWWFVGQPLLGSRWLPFSGLKRGVLAAFGARIGRGVVIRAGVKVKYPWRLSVGDQVWIGEDVWIDNLDQVSIGAHCCISQGAYLCTGSHDARDPAFGLKIGPIRIADQCWVCAKAVVLRDATLATGTMLAAGSVLGGGEYGPWRRLVGNPAVDVGPREERSGPA